ncbi:MAG: hypothetical protein K0U52_07160, partial [Gammaproteobacteria bacterium]|nr:hypothetical protein [Gammaproteobacteria bacterium]
PNPSYNWRPAIQWSTSTRSAISVNPGEREMDMQDYANDSSPRSTIMVLNDPTSSMHYQVVYMFGYRRGHYNLLYDPNVFKQEEAIGLTLSLVMNKEE